MRSDPSANPYFAFAAFLMAGLDEFKTKITLEIQQKLYDLPPEEDAQIPTICSSLEEALESLNNDKEFLMKGDVFSSDMIEAYIELKMEDVTRLRMTTHPAEFDMYYSV